MNKLEWEISPGPGRKTSLIFIAKLQELNTINLLLFLSLLGV